MDISGYFQGLKRPTVEEGQNFEDAVILGQETSCVPHFDQLMYCYSPANQVSTYYMRGTIDPCQESQKNFFKCLSVKFNKPLEEKKQILREINKVEENSPTKSVWSFRKDPAADWNPETN